MTHRPQPLGDMRLHLTLTRGMADATGTDAAGAFADGRLDNAEWADALMTCRECSQVLACRRWQGQRVEGPRAIPKMCGNHAFFKRLKGGQWPP
ncbi:hypothetical protein SAMN05444004_102142 [Jannaschia faecimaris]|uniref:DUF6455 domain-containing protein n=1 Tax=Jannaschia faecimaris TaxID=1244108 RepID=A0A1H3LCD6_9RHOB|nr:DUF6455 family protein [Jannaschia faecimaris]SDY61535.1 hypothetical protein SAMN05444004_102142 [Jannaschia faecimaris]